MNYTWVMRSNLLFLFIGSYMVNKPQNSEPQSSIDASRVIQTNAAGHITGSLTTIAQEGNFDVIDVSKRSMLYLYPSISFPVSKWGAHDFKSGVEPYPFLQNRSDAAFEFLSADARSANFGVKTNFVQPRVGQVGIRFVF